MIEVDVRGGEDNGKFSFNPPPAAQAWTITGGIIDVYDYNHVRIRSTISGRNYVTLTTISDGRQYKIDKADGVNVTIGGHSVAFPMIEIGATSGAGGGNAAYSHANTGDRTHVLFLRKEGIYASPRKLQAVALARDYQAGTSVDETSGGKIYSEMTNENDIIIGWSKKNSDTAIKASLQLNGVVVDSPGSLDIAAIANNSITNALTKKGAQPFATNIVFTPAQSDGSAPASNQSNAVYNAFRWHNGSNAAGNISFGQDMNNNVAINTGHSTGLTASTTYYAYLTIPASGNGTISVTDDYRIPFDDDKVLLATVVIGASQALAHTPTILPYNGKVPTISAVSIAANAITADMIQAGTITADEIEAGTITADKLEAGTITTRLSGSNTSDMPGVTLNSSGQIYSGKTSYGSGTGYILDYNSGFPRVDIGSTTQYLRLTGSALDIVGEM